MVAAGGTIALLAWIYLTAFHGRFWRVGRLIQHASELPDGAAGRRVAVVIPARDEEQSIGAAIKSLCRQDWPGPLHIWVADDESSDGTAGRALAAGGSSVTVVRCEKRPRGWTGKVWAMAEGVNAAASWGPDYLLFTDADVVHAPDSARTLVSIGETGSLDLVSAMVRLRCESLAERLLIPAFVFFFFKLYPPDKIRRRRSRTAGAAGGCILLRPEALKRAGGLKAIQGEIIDDCALAHALKSSGGSLSLGLAKETQSIRPYRTFGDVRQMIARTAFTQLRYSPVILAGAVAGMMLLYVVPVAAAIAGNLAGLAAWVLMSAVYAPTLRYFRQPLLFAPLLPGVALFYTVATIESAIAYWRGTGGHWKGRAMAGSAGQTR